MFHRPGWSPRHGVRAWITSGTQETPAHVDGGGGQAVPLGGGVPTADHEVVGEAHASGRHTAVTNVVRHRTADAAHHTSWREGGRGRGSSSSSTTMDFHQAFNSPMPHPNLNEYIYPITEHRSSLLIALQGRLLSYSPFLKTERGTKVTMPFRLCFSLHVHVTPALHTVALILSYICSSVRGVHCNKAS